MTKALNDTTGETAKFLFALSQTMDNNKVSLEALIGDITKENARTLFNFMAARGLPPTSAEYERLVGEIFKRWP
jgi:hypothetical protein